MVKNINFEGPFGSTFKLLAHQKSLNSHFSFQLFLWLMNIARIPLEYRQQKVVLLAAVSQEEEKYELCDARLAIFRLFALLHPAQSPASMLGLKTFSIMQINTLS